MMKLHEAIETVLREQPKNTASIKLISNEIFNRGLYFIKRRQ